MMGENVATFTLPLAGARTRGRAIISKASIFSAIYVAVLFTGSWESAAQPQRILGTDISYWNCGTGSGLLQSHWNTAFSTGNRKYVFIRATRGGTTGVDQPSGTPGGGSTSTLSKRYDDSRFTQNLTRALASGMLVGPYHYGRPDVAGNTGADEADHFIEMAGAWMRPGYMMPMYDLEIGSALGGSVLAQFAIDFSNRLHERMRIRPCVYINGNYSSIIQGGASAAQLAALAEPSSYTPSVVGPCYPMLWNARYSDNANPEAIPIQTGTPKTTYTLSSGYYGPWDDFGDPNPWSFWQYASTVSIPGINQVDVDVDGDVSHGDMEYVRNYLVPAVWMSDVSGDWSTLTNWNSGQTPIAPVLAPGQAPPYEPNPTLPTPRLPGAAGTDQTSGQYDTVILERANSNITVNLTTGTHNVRKLYMRETLQISAGSLTVNYHPGYRPDDSLDVLHGGPISAQFSGPVTLSGSGTLQINTLQVDAPQVFTLSGGTFRFLQVNLMPGFGPSKMQFNGNVTLIALSNATANISNGTGGGSSGFIDLGGATRALLLTNGTADVDLAIHVPITNGGLTKSGPGTMALDAASTYAGGTTVAMGRLLVNNTTGSGTGSGSVAVSSSTILGGTGTIAGALTVNVGGTLAPGGTTSRGTLTLNTAPVLSGTNLFRIDRSGVPSSDKLVVTTGTLAFGGRLVVTNAGASLVGGEQFTLLQADTYAGTFSATNLPSLNGGLNWFLGNLTVNGSIFVNRTPVAFGYSTTNTPGQVLQIPISSLIASGSDPDGSALVLASLSATTTNGVPLSTNATHILYQNNANVQDRFSYTLSDGQGGTATGFVTISPGPVFAPTVTIDPSSLTVNAGQDATFIVTASGTQPFSYQWRFNGSSIGNATASSYTVTNAQPSNAGLYSVVVTNAGGTDTSAEATLVVNVPPEITAQPQSVTNVAGTDASFAVTATGTAPLGYQWHFEGQPISSATNNSYVRTNAQTEHAGAYSVVVSNVAGMVTSSIAGLTITQPMPPSIVSYGFVSNGFRLHVEGSPGAYTIEASSNFLSWDALTNLTSTNTTFDYTDPNTNLSLRGYRVKRD